MICDIWKDFILQCLNCAYVAAIPRSPGLGALRSEERIFCCGFHSTCPSLLHMVCTDTAPASPKTSNPDTTTSCDLSHHPSKQHRQALFLWVTFVTERFPAAKLNSEQVYLYRDEQDLVSNTKPQPKVSL